MGGLGGIKLDENPNYIVKNCHPLQILLIEMVKKRLSTRHLQPLAFNDGNESKQL